MTLVLMVVEVVAGFVVVEGAAADSTASKGKELALIRCRSSSNRE